MEFVEFSFSGFEERFFKKYQTQNVVGFIKDLMDKLKKENRIGSANTYKDTTNRIIEFEAKVLFHEIDLKFLEDFERYLINKGNSINTIGLYMRTLRAIYNKAIGAGILNGEAYPFKKYKIKTGSPSKRALTKDDMDRLISYQAEENTSTWHSLNNFVLKRISRDVFAIASELKIKDANKITHYWARHTYATTLKRSGISISIISEALGHNSEATTKAYLDKFEQTEIDNTFRHLI